MSLYSFMSLVQIRFAEPDQAEKNVDLVPRPTVTSLFGQRNTNLQFVNYKCWNHQKWWFFHFTPVD